MDFGEILTRSWNLIWKHKILWLFGFLAALGTSSGNGNAGSGTNYSNGNGQNFNFNGPRMEDVPLWLRNLVESMPIWLPILLILFVLVMIVVIIILSTYGRIGLTRGAWLADEGQERLSFGSLWGYGTRYFWRTVAMILISVAVSIVIGLIVLIPTVVASIVTFGLALICLLPLLCVIGIGFSLLGVLFDLAIVGIANEDLSVMDALRRAWEIFKANLVQIIGMALILWIISLVIGFILFMPVLLIVAPVIIGAVSQTEAALGGGLLVSLVLFLLYLPVLMLVRGILQSYIGSAWTLVYRRLTGRPAVSSAAL